MSEVESPPVSVEPEEAKSIRVDEDPAGFINQQLEKMKMSEGDAAPEALVIESPNEPGNTEPQSRWDDEIIPEGTEGVSKFFWGKPVRELNKSYRNAEQKIREQAEELQRARAQVAGEETLKAYAELFRQQQAAIQPQVKEPDPYDGINWETDPIIDGRKVATTIEERAVARANQIVEQRLYAERQRMSMEEQEAAKRQAYTNAMLEAQRQLNLDDEGMETFFRPLTEMVLRDEALGDYRVYDPSAYVQAFDRLRSKLVAPSPAQVSTPPTPIPEPANPPGSKRTAAGGPTPKGVPTLKSEQSAILDQMALTLQSAGVPFDAERFKQDAAGRMAKA